MRGTNELRGQLFHYFNVDDRIPKDHPIRKIREIADTVLKELNREFNEMYAERGRPSIPPERLLKASILIMLYTIRSDRQFCEQLNYNFMYRWFLGMDLETESFDHSTFSKNRERLIESNIAKKFFEAVVRLARKKKVISEEHFSVDGTLIQAWASYKSFQAKNPGKKPDDPEDYRGEKRSNETHQSITDSEARLMRKSNGDKAILAYTANVLMENRNGLCVDIQVDKATHSAERDAAKKLIIREKRRNKRIKTVAADKGYHAQEFVSFLRKKRLKPHIAVVKGRKSRGLDGRTIDSQGYKISLMVRKRIETIFGWIKTIGGMRQVRLRGMVKNQVGMYLTATAYNLRRMANLCLS
jgi:transposase